MEANYAKLLQRALKLTKNEEDAQDLVQDAYLKFFESYPDFDGTEEEQIKMLQTIITNQNIDNHRKKTEISFSDLDIVDQETGESITYEPMGTYGDVNYDDVERIIFSLPKKIRQACSLVLLEGKSYQEAASELGISVTAITSRLYKGKLLIKKELED